MANKYTADQILTIKKDLYLSGYFKTGYPSEVDKSTELLAEILSILGSQDNMSINCATAILDDCKTLLGMLGRI